MKITFPWKKKTTLCKNFVTIEEELDGNDIGNIGNLEYLPWLVFVDEECGNCKLVADGGEVTRNIDKKKKSGVSLAYRCPLCKKYCRRVFLQ